MLTIVSSGGYQELLEEIGASVWPRARFGARNGQKSPNERRL